jgi:hypothetical protein
MGMVGGKEKSAAAKRQVENSITFHRRRTLLKTARQRSKAESAKRTRQEVAFNRWWSGKGFAFPD